MIVGQNDCMPHIIVFQMIVGQNDCMPHIIVWKMIVWQNYCMPHIIVWKMIVLHVVKYEYLIRCLKKKCRKSLFSISNVEFYTSKSV